MRSEGPDTDLSVELMCRKANVHHSFSATVGIHGGASSVSSKAWCSKVDDMLAVSCDKSAAVQTLEDFANEAAHWQEPEEFTQLCDGPSAPVIKRRALKVRRLFLHPQEEDGEDDEEEGGG